MTQRSGQVNICCLGSLEVAQKCAVCMESEMDGLLAYSV